VRVGLSLLALFAALAAPRPSSAEVYLVGFIPHAPYTEVLMRQERNGSWEDVDLSDALVRTVDCTQIVVDLPTSEPVQVAGRVGQGIRTAWSLDVPLVLEAAVRPLEDGEWSGDLNLIPVPEPETWKMQLTALITVGVIALWKRRSRE
jgi:hypothetical protein